MREVVHAPGIGTVDGKHGNMGTWTLCFMGDMVMMSDSYVLVVGG